ncbi:MAG: hypothetical protein JMDDDDMK_04679 [Acidobacteria bacterium]|nr:hypothetical protein [Acidobacteriota bacterium]
MSCVAFEEEDMPLPILPVVERRKAHRREVRAYRSVVNVLPRDAVCIDGLNDEASELIVGFSRFFLRIARRFVKQPVSHAADRQMINARPSARPIAFADLLPVDGVSHRIARPRVHAQQIVSAVVIVEAEKILVLPVAVRRDGHRAEIRLAVVVKVERANLARERIERD